MFSGKDYKFHTFTIKATFADYSTRAHELFCIHAYSSENETMLHSKHKSAYAVLNL